MHLNIVGSQILAGSEESKRKEKRERKKKKVFTIFFLTLSFSNVKIQKGNKKFKKEIQSLNYESHNALDPRKINLLATKVIPRVEISTPWNLII